MKVSSPPWTWKTKQSESHQVWPIQVIMFKNTSSTYYQDAYMVPSQMGSRDRYFTSAYFRSSAAQCSSDDSKQFYLITSFYDETVVDISQQDGTVYELELPEFGTFVQSTLDPDNHLAQGTEITASKPINVVSGDICMTNRAAGSHYADTYASSIPDVYHLGNEYIVPSILGDDSPAGYSVSVVSTENQTTVQAKSQEYTLDKGESAVFEYDYHNESVHLNCSQPCLVVQYSKSLYDSYGLFMQEILPQSEFYTSSFFTTLDSSPVSYLSLVLKGESPGDNLHLNGTSLEHLEWRAINGYTTAELSINQGVYELDSQDGRPFAAYVYLHTNTYAAGAGFTVLPTESSQVPTPLTTTTIPTTTTPSPSESLPQHTVRVNGTAYTEDGEDMTPQCAVVWHTCTFSAVFDLYCYYWSYNHECL